MQIFLRKIYQFLIKKSDFVTSIAKFGVIFCKMPLL